jgi:hypothetical protein
MTRKTVFQIADDDAKLKYKRRSTEPSNKKDGYIGVLIVIIATSFFATTWAILSVLPEVVKFIFS